MLSRALMDLPVVPQIPIAAGADISAHDPYAQQLEILNEIARLATFDVELRPMLQRITDALARKFDWPFVALVSVDTERLNFVCEAVTSAVSTEVHVGYGRPLGSGVVGEVAATERPILLDDVRTFANYVETMPGAQSELCVPVKHGGRLVAILNVESTHRAAFHGQLPLLMTVADQVAGAIASARMYAEIEERARLMEMMSEVSRTALQATDLDELLERVVQYVFSHFPLVLTAVLFRDSLTHEFVLEAYAGETTLPKGARSTIDSGVVGRCLRSGTTQLVLDVTRDADYLVVSQSVTSELVVPIRFDGQVLGVFNLEASSPDVFTPANVLAFEMFADQVAGAIHLASLNQLLESRTRELEEANERLQRLSATDGLTGVANRRRFDELLDLEWRRAARSKAPLSLLMIDIDEFKPFNDRHGHQAGDDCLRRVANTIADSLHRAADLVARYGGEEFVVLLPETAPAHALRLAEMLRTRVESLGIVTISIGVATTGPEVTSSEELLAGADDALYQAKRTGRNRVVVR